MKNARVTSRLLFLVLGLAATLGAGRAQMVEKFQPATSGSDSYAFDVSLPATETIKMVGIEADGKAIDAKKITFAPVDSGDYTANILFLVDKAAGAGTQSSTIDARAFQSVLRQTVKKIAAANDRHTKGSSSKPLYHVGLAAVEGAAYQELAPVDADPARIDSAIAGLHLSTGDQTIARGMENVLSEFEAKPADRKYIVLLSTGEFTDKSDALAEIESAAKQGNVKISTIAFDTGRFESGQSELNSLAADTQGFALSTDRVDSTGYFDLDGSSLDKLVAYMVAGAKGTVDLTGVSLPATFRFDLTTDLGKIYAVEQKVSADTTATPVPSTPVATPTGTTTPATPKPATPSTNAPSTNAPPVTNAPSTNQAPVSPKVSTVTPPAAPKSPTDQVQDWITSHLDETIGGVVGLLIVIMAIVFLARKNAPAKSLPGDDESSSIRQSDEEPEATRMVNDSLGSPSSQAEAWLTDGDNRYPIDGASVRIGRKPDNDIVIPNDSVSNYHAEIIRRDGSYYIVDRGSSNKVFIDGQPVHNVPLNEGDVIELGDIRLRFHLNQN